MIADPDDSQLCGGAVGGIARDQLPEIVANLLDHEQEFALWIRPEHMTADYAVEWITVECGDEQLEWQPQKDTSRDAATRIKTVWTAVRQLLTWITPIVPVGEIGMPTFDVDREQINVFAIDDTYLFKYYFEEDDLFAELRRYYNEDEYRFEVPADTFDEVQELLRDHFYEPRVVDEPERFCVVQPRYSDHPDVLFKASVLQRSQDNFHVFLMKDQVSVEQAINTGAKRLADTDLKNPL